PIIISLITGTMSKYEKQANNWEHLLMIPAKGTVFFLSKMAWTVIIILSAQLLMFGLQIVLGYASGYTDQIPIGTYLSAVILGTAGAISLGTLLFYFYLRMKSASDGPDDQHILKFPLLLGLFEQYGLVDSSPLSMGTAALWDDKCICRHRQAGSIFYRLRRDDSDLLAAQH
ncbi:ABC transporter permease, partial [Vibrio hannami]